MLSEKRRVKRSIAGEFGPAPPATAIVTCGELSLHAVKGIASSTGRTSIHPRQPQVCSGRC